MVNKDISLVDFVQDTLDIKLLPHQKAYLSAISGNNADRYKQIIYARGQQTSRYVYAWLYKKMWEQYCETGECKFPIDYDNEENFKREYECIWSDEDDK